MSLDLQLEMLDERGYLLLPGVLEPLRIALLRCAIDDLQPIHWDYQGLLEHYKCVFNRNPLWLPFLDLPPLIALAEAALGADCHVIGQTAWRSHPGYPGMALHLDHLPMQLPDWLSERGDFTQPPANPDCAAVPQRYRPSHRADLDCARQPPRGTATAGWRATLAGP